MSDLYRKCPECEGTGGWHGEGEFCDGCFGDGFIDADWLVKVEPDRMVWVDEDGLIRERGLPAGHYALVRLEVERPAEFARRHGREGDPDNITREVGHGGKPEGNDAP